MTVKTASTAKAQAPTSSHASTGSHPRWILITDMKTSPVAQREFDPHHAEEYAADFDIDALGTPVLNLREGRWYIVDGQHRVAALKMIGYGDQSLLCNCFEGLTEQQEAELFLRLNNRRAIRKFDQFRLSTVAQREQACDIERIVLANGLRISKTKQAGGVGAVASLESVYKKHGPTVLARTLVLLRDSYSAAPEAFGPDTIKGVGMLCARYNGTLDDSAVVAKLGAQRGGVTQLRQRSASLRAQLGKPVDACTAAAVVDIFNTGKGGKKLPNWWS